MLVKVAVNGEKHEAEVEPRLLLVHLIRENLRLTGTHIGCDTSHCGACTVLLDGRPVKSCSVFAVQAHGREISTVEGLEQDGQVHHFQEGFIAEHGVPCGYCTPVDAVVLPVMLCLDSVRSAFACAKIRKIDSRKALAIPGVLAVITGQDLSKYNLHWMPSLMWDTQMVLPVEKVMYQAQEVAAVLATDRYIAAAGVQAGPGGSQPCPAAGDPFQVFEPGG